MKIPNLKLEEEQFSKNKFGDATEYQVKLEEIAISVNDLEKILGYELGNTPVFYQEKIDKMWQEAFSKVAIRVGYFILPVDQFKWQQTTLICGKVKFLSGKIIANQLRNSETVAVFAGTAGNAFDIWSKQLFDQGDFPEGYIADIMGSEIVEAAIDWLEVKIQEKLKPLSLKMTNRFSPGYCGWNVREQFKLFSLLPENFCGITLTDSALMVPIKSVSGIIGIGETVEKIGYPCDVCTMKNCYRRRKYEKDL
jgi:hypothetical protein